MTLNGVTAFIFCVTSPNSANSVASSAHCVKVVEVVVVKKFTFAISSPDEFVVGICEQTDIHAHTSFMSVFQIITYEPTTVPVWHYSFVLCCASAERLVEQFVKKVKKERGL